MWQVTFENKRGGSSIKRISDKKNLIEFVSKLKTEATIWYNHKIDGRVWKNQESNKWNWYFGEYSINE